jgi:hypothetical protein
LPLLKPLAWPRRVRLTLIAVVCLGTFVALALAPRMPIGPSYHDFADKRTLWGISNALDVLSNIPFVLVGLWGCAWLLTAQSRRVFLDQRERIPWLIFFAGVTLTGAGSWWYHLAPSNTRLPWDLLPMTCSFLSVVAAMVMERISLRAGLAALVPMLLLGMASVVYWMVTASQGHDDYKFYLMVQFFSPVVLALIVTLFPPRYTGMGWLAVAFVLYVAAKLFEVFDYQIYGWGHVVSGHALKHITAAVACIWILRMLQVRQPVVRRQAATAPPLSWAAK